MLVRAMKSRKRSLVCGVSDDSNREAEETTEGKDTEPTLEAEEDDGAEARGDKWGKLLAAESRRGGCCRLDSEPALPL